ncbi:MAG TPA: Gfo/Idh/MocA family oxidoreductase [Chloroflexota bacterium]|nr:Gfo/Idh/MocA family oxidoreductase [Chloroflexota bacterium]
MLRLAVVGGRRGRALGGVLAALGAQVEVVAVCDHTEPTRRAWVEAWRGPGGAPAAFESYERLLDEAPCDAVLLATPMTQHAPQAMRALRAGRHVLSEVVAATTLEECWALVEAVEASGKIYMLAENYCYTRPNMMVRHMVERGVFGQCTYAEGAYIHDTRDLLFTAQGALTWRGEIARTHGGNTYPTHALGAVAQWLGTAGPGAADRLVETATWSTPDASRWRYVAERLGSDHEAARPGFFAAGDTATTLVRTARGALISLRRDAASPRPHNMTHYHLQGTQASYLSPRHGGEDPLVWIAGRSPGTSPGDARWEPLWAYAAEFEHPSWRAHGAAAGRAGHGGGDYFVVQAFLEAVRAGTPSPIDVYDAVAWSSLMPLSQESVAGGGAPVAIPDFRRGRG